MTNSTNGWYYMDRDWRGGSLVYGPYTTEQLKEIYKKGDINEKTQIRYGLRSHWQPLKEVPFFSDEKSGLQFNLNISEYWKRYGKWGIVIAAILFVLLYVRSQASYKALQSSQSGKNSTRSAHYEALNREAIIRLTNETRASSGLSPLHENTLLNVIAEARAEDMFEKQYFAHVSPTGEQASDIAQRIGYQYRIMAENIGSGRFLTNQKVIDGWMQSPGHRKNILAVDIEDIGAAIIKGRLDGNETWIAVQIFGLRSPSASQKVCVRPSEALHNDIEIKRAEINDLRDRLDKLKEELDDENSSIERDRQLLPASSTDKKNLNIKIKAYNEKIDWYNKRTADIRAKSQVLKAMIKEYNDMLQTYNDCRNSD